MIQVVKNGKPATITSQQQMPQITEEEKAMLIQQQIQQQKLLSKGCNNK